MIYTTSDLHGYPLDSFLRMLEQAGFGDTDTLYVLGDVIDRNGDGGVAMLRWIMSRPNVRFILGNHEAMLLSCGFLYDGIDDGEETELLDPDRLHALMRWMRNGCEPTLQTLQELKEKNPEALQELLSFLEKLPFMRKSVPAEGNLCWFIPDLKTFHPKGPWMIMNRMSCCGTGHMRKNVSIQIK